MQFGNYNDIIRNNLYSIYHKLEQKYDKVESEIKYQEALDIIKTNSPEFYEKVIGLFFLDCYRYCLYQEKTGKISSTCQYLLEIGDSIQDMEDLLFKIEEEPHFYSSIITFSHFYVKQLPITTKAQMLNMLEDSKAMSFSKFHLLEKYSMFSSITLDDLLSNYYSVNGNKCEENHEIGIRTIIDKLDVLSIGNCHNYIKLLLGIIKECYIWKKCLQTLYPHLLYDLDKRLIELVETKQLSELTYEVYLEQDLLISLLDDYVYYHDNLKEDGLSFEKAMEIYQIYASQEVKTKLKEV